MRKPLTVAGGVALFGVTVAVLLAFDRGSHSVSDMVRPFVITTLPVWIAAVAAGRLLVGTPPPK